MELYIQENNQFAPQLYIRQGRRVVIDYMINQQQWLGKQVTYDPVDKEVYCMIFYNTLQTVVNDMVKKEGDIKVSGLNSGFVETLK